MARYTGPKHKLARREGINIIEKNSASLLRRLNVPPGLHSKRNKRRLSEFGQQLREKQKAKAVYGLLEKQLKRLVTTVTKQKGDTEKLLLALLERRLDNIVYRLGFAKSRFMSRQLVSHGHILVNNKKLTIPSYEVKEGDVITLGGKMQKNALVIKTIEDTKEIVPFLEKKGAAGKLVRLPSPDDIKAPFSTRQIIEYYSR
ncbi:30S ribosomal protein S4 [Patescibacteria group bacterium]|nr:30S ribosomal protein S4 [Patescibacteria group bacterium]MBU4016736.1 30S ribosomal protein S4 [Patescibacteria group bacterium]